MSTAPFRFGLQIGRAESRVEWQDAARRAEALGFSSVLVPDHVADGLLSPMVALATLAEATAELLDAPYMLIGTVDEICAQLLAARERFGFTYFVTRDPEKTAPVIDALR